MKNKDLFRRIAAAVFAAVLVCLIAWSGSTDAADSVVSDAFYQHESAGGEDIVIVEIDERAMQELGPWPWSRSVMAEVIRTLAEKDCIKIAVNIKNLHSCVNRVIPASHEEVSKPC